MNSTNKNNHGLNYLNIFKKIRLFGTKEMQQGIEGGTWKRNNREIIMGMRIFFVRRKVREILILGKCEWDCRDIVWGWEVWEEVWCMVERVSERVCGS